MTVTTIYGEEGERGLRSTHATYATRRSGAGATITVDNDPTPGQYPAGNQVLEGFMGFDTSGIPDGDTIQSVELSASFIGVYLRNHSLWAYLYDWGGGTITSADWVPGANLSSMTRVATRAMVTGETGRLVFSEDGTNFRNGINKTGFTRLVIVSQDFVEGNATAEFSQYRGSWNTSTTNDTRLVVTHQADGGGGGGSTNQSAMIL